MRWARSALFAAAVIATGAAIGRAADLTVTLPDGASVKFAAAQAPSTAAGEEGVGTAGAMSGGAIQFTGLNAQTPYDLKIRLANGVVLHGVNMDWYSLEPADPAAGAITDDDRSQIKALVSDIKSFYNVSRVLALRGDHNRATVLVERIRSSNFVGDKNGEVIWRVELWYFVNEFGGWQERPQSARVVRRERFKSQVEYQTEAGPVRWIEALGGIEFQKADEKRTIAVTQEMAAGPATQP